MSNKLTTPAAPLFPSLAAYPRLSAGSRSLARLWITSGTYLDLYPVWAVHYQQRPQGQGSVFLQGMPCLRLW
jgi:hypothetical protein